MVSHFNQSKLQTPYNDPQSLQNLAPIASLDFSALIGPSVSLLSHTGATLFFKHSLYPFDLAVPSAMKEILKVKMLVTHSFPALCDPMDCSPPGSSVHGIFQARILKWVAISYFRGSSRPRGRIHVSCIAGGFFTAESSGKPIKLSSNLPNKYFI